MRILLVSGNIQTTELFKNYIGSIISELLKLPEFHDGTHKLGIIMPGDHNQVEIKDTGLVSFEINSAGGEVIQIPNLTPNLVREVNSFLNEFQPDIVHSFDAGFIGVMTQFFSVTKQIPFILSMIPGHSDQEKGLTSKILAAILGQSGVSAEFIKNYYNNATVLIGQKSELIQAQEKGGFTGMVLNSNEVSTGQTLLAFYTRLLAGQKRYLRLKPNNVAIKNQENVKRVGLVAFIIALAAVIGSIFAFTAVKSVSKFKHKLPNSKNHK